MVMLFYIWDPDKDSLPPIFVPSEITVEIWRPGCSSIRPQGLPMMPYAAWWIFHYCRVFSNGEYGVVILRSNFQIVHFSLVTPPYFRFPDMADSDVQIGATFTDPLWRGRGLAKAAIGIICDAWRTRIAKLWYIVDETNAASIRVIENSQFQLAGTGERTTRFGMATLGEFRMLRPYHRREE